MQWTAQRQKEQLDLEENEALQDETSVPSFGEPTYGTTEWLQLPSQPVLKDLLNRIWLWERCDKKDMTRMSQSARDVKAGIPAAVLLNSLIQLISSRLLLPKSILLSPEGSDPAQVAVDSVLKRHWTLCGSCLHLAVD